MRKYTIYEVSKIKKKQTKTKSKSKERRLAKIRKVRNKKWRIMKS